MRAKEFINENVTELYHGTLRTNVPSILANGLNPTVGEFTKSIYANKAKPLVFAADIKGSRAVYCALQSQIGMKLGKFPLSAEEIAEYGALLVISKDVNKFRQYNSKRRMGSKEPTDYTSQETIHIDKVITGKELLQWIKTHNADWGEMSCPVDIKQGVAEGSGFDQQAGIGIDGKSYKFKIRDLVAFAEKYPVTKVNPKEFIQQIKGRDEDPTQSMARAEKADLQYPIIVVKRKNGQLWIADGTHRAHKAILNKLPTVNAKIIPIDDMESFEIKKVDEAPLPPDWDKEQLNLRQTFKNRIKYAVSKAQKLGTGSSRVAFVIPYEGRNTVLKVAKNLKGLAQNEAELQILNDYVIGQSDIVIPLIDYDKDNNRPVWLQTEMASKIGMRPLLQLLRTPTLWFLTDAVKYRLSLPDKPKYLNKPADLKEKYFDPKMWTYGGEPSEQSFEMFNEYVDKLSELKDSSQIELGDLQNNLNWGQFMGRPVVIDLGLSSEVWSKYYLLK